jgi:hypothetical protein
VATVAPTHPSPDTAEPAAGRPARYPGLVCGEAEPSALGDWNFVLALALGLRGEDSFAY